MHNSNNKSVQQMITVQTIQDKLRQKPGVSASIQFYDMADRYFLTIGAYHQELSDNRVPPDFHSGHPEIPLGPEYILLRSHPEVFC